jgi:hypothetical protein
LNFTIKLQIEEILLARQGVGVRIYKELPEEDLNFVLKLQIVDILLARQ